MKFENEILAYALQNAIEHDKADASRILPKLFRHGLEKKDIGKIMPLIKEIVDEVNSMNDKEKKKTFVKFSKFVKQREKKEEGLPELQGIGSKKPVFRLAPFPSGALHLGNAKTYVLNALYAERYKGKVILVMDDTIGSVEKPIAKEAYKLIEDAFKWLGINYGKKIVYKSDRLNIYYKYAEKLIEKDKAYVCYCSAEKVRFNRAERKVCGCRILPKDVQAERWKEMFKMKEGHAVLRIKTSMQDKNPAFRDRILFKISDRKHPRVGKKYRVWPSLEMSWSVDDYLLKITHIIRGNDLVMETEMEKFIWDIFGWKHPQVIHTGLIKIVGVGAKISKSKAQKEVKSGEFIGWDDPRTWSMQSLERRGIKPESIRKFVEGIGLNKQDITVPIETLYSINRGLIDEEAGRFSFVKNLMKLEIKNEFDVEDIYVPVHPSSNEKRKVEMKKDIFISGEDYKKFYGKEVRLLHLFNLKLEKESEVISVENEDAKKMPKINWVSNFVKSRVLMPEGNYMEGIAESGVSKLKKGDVIQFERFGFVRFDGKKKGVYEFWFGHN